MKFYLVIFFIIIFSVAKSQNPDNAPLKTSYQFNTSNFDDGWVAVEQSDWVLVTKGNIRVKLHYPGTDIKAPNTDPAPMAAAAWNTLVAPRYKNIQGYRSAPNTLTRERAYFAQATLLDATGKRVFVALFSKGHSGWIEVICPDAATFINVFGVDISKINYYTEDAIWAKLQNLSTYNKFAVSPNDLTGTWKSNFGENTYYANIYTGLSAGMSSYSSNQQFDFLGGKKYKWKLVAANSYGGASSFAGARGEGTLTMNGNWQISFSDIEGKPKNYAVQFSCVKGGRVLFVGDDRFMKID